MRKGQSEIVSFVLLFLIGVALFLAAVTWGRGSFDRNVDIARITATESFIVELDNSIQSVAKFGGEKIIDYKSDGVIILNDIDAEDTLEIRSDIEGELPKYWINLTTSESFGLIREKLEGTIFIVQLSYPNKENYGIDLFTTGPREAKPQIIVIEKNSTYVDTSGTTMIKIELKFQ